MSEHSEQGVGPASIRAGEAELRQHADLYRLLFERSPLGIFHYDTGLRIIACNESLCRILHSSFDRLVGLDMHQLRDRRPLGSLETALEGHHGLYEGPYEATTSSAGIVVALRTVPVTAPDGTVLGGMAIVEDVTERRQIEEIQTAIYQLSDATLRAEDLDSLYPAIHKILGRLMPAENLYVALYDEAAETLSFPYFVDRYDPPPPPQKARYGLTEYVLKTEEPLLATTGEELEAKIRREGLDAGGATPTSWLGVPLKTRRATIGVLVLQSYDQDAAFSEQDREILIFVAHQVANAIERKRHEAQIEHMAYFDGLTGLYNRRMLHERAAQVLALAERHDWQSSLLYLDLDRFKNVNDTLGHDAGDELLVAVAQQLRSCLRKSDTLARLGGDEFAYLLHNAGTREAAQMARQLVDRLERPFEIQGHRVHLGASIGVALFPQHGATLDELLKNADIAMYRAKAEGVGFAFFDYERSPYSRQRLELEDELRRAVDEGLLELYYQPLLDLASGGWSGVEALVRWPRGERVLAADEFIPLAEESDLIRRLDWRVLELALSQAAALRTALPGIRLSVNLSARSLHHEGLVDHVQALLTLHHLPADCLILEITESAAVRNPEASFRALAELDALGVRLAIDDFGTGFASLTYLRSMPLDRVKLDKALLHEMATRPRGERLLEAAATLGHALDLEVVVEGIETAEQLEWLRHRGFDTAQGYYIARPQPLAEVLEALKSPPPR